MRLYNYLNEKESRDRLFRSEANRIISNIQDYINRFDSEELDDILNRREHSQFGTVWTLDYTNIDNTYDLLVMFTPQKSVNFSIGTYKQIPILVLPIVYKNDPDTIKTNLNTSKRQIKHELIHFLDKERKALVLNKGSSELKSAKEYYNSPSEFNAFYQEAVDEVIEVLEKRGKDKSFIKTLGLDTVTGFVNTVKDLYIDGEFLKYLNSKYMRKLNKRLADLYQQLKDDGVIEIN